MSSILSWNVLPRNVGGIGLAIRRETLGDADARTIKFADDPFLIIDFNCLPTLSKGSVDHVGGPPKRNRFLAKVESLHQDWAIFLDELFAKCFEINLDHFLLVCTLFNLLGPLSCSAAMIVAVCARLFLHVRLEIHWLKRLVGDDTIVVKEIL